MFAPIAIIKEIMTLRIDKNLAFVLVSIIVGNAYAIYSVDQKLSALNTKVNNIEKQISNESINNWLVKMNELKIALDANLNNKKKGK